jgi:hypothetical protein
MNNDFQLLINLVSLGFFSSFAHCSMMCGPFVVSQTANRLEKIAISDYVFFSKVANSSLISYHLGRITTYSIIGFLSSLLGNNFKENLSFNIASSILLIIGSISFLLIAFNFKFSDFLAKKNIKIRLRIKSKYLQNNFVFLASYPKKFLTFLFKNPTSYRGYLLGLILGFIPCGLLYSAYLICISFSDAKIAFLAMALFGISTFPSLFLTSLFGGMAVRSIKFKFIAKFILIINSIILALMAFEFIKN